MRLKPASLRYVSMARHQHGFRFTVFASLLLCCWSYKSYQDEIPNGDSVPHPCKPNYKWKGVGHQAVLGEGARNPFGEAFAAAGGTWTDGLCQADSDGDGKTNGEELGDPNCIWSRGAAPPETTGLSHPGICEPVDSANCTGKNSWSIDCSDGADFTCDGIADEETLNVTLLLDRTRVPAQETTYMCQSFTFPSDKVYHLFASRPDIDNAHVMHHTVVYGCHNEDAGFATPAPCGMGGQACRGTVIAFWTLGSSGECQGPKNGIRVGKGHFTTVVIQQHWNNPEKREDYYDASGMTLFLTPKLRPNNLGFFTTGQESLTIPPGKSAYTLGGVCPKSCLSQQLKKPIYITMAHVHMHYLGFVGKIEQWRDGKLLKTWFDESEYSYDLPVFNKFDPPLELRREDEIRTICIYRSTSRNETATFGLGTSDEMCYGVMGYYPIEAKNEDCVSKKELNACQRQRGDNNQHTTTEQLKEDNGQQTTTDSGSTQLTFSVFIALGCMLLMI